MMMSTQSSIFFLILSGLILRLNGMDLSSELDMVLVVNEN
jgi:hypothetical protein